MNPSVMFLVLISVLGLGSKVRAGSESVLHAFTLSTGYAPVGGVVFDGAGNLYGTAYYGGSTACEGQGCGVVFKLTPGAGGNWTYTEIYTFTGGTDGSHPTSTLVFDAAGNLYGATTGEYFRGEFGTVFKLAPNLNGSWSFALVHSFGGGSDGMEPYFLIVDEAGNLYGTTLHGGASNAGTVFSLTPTSGGKWKESLLHTFTGCLDGALPANLAVDSKGNLYGTTQRGGTACYPAGAGVAFELAPRSGGRWQEMVLHRFTGGTDGGIPGNLMFDSAGILYGVALTGGNVSDCFNSGCGLVFQLTQGTNGSWNESVLHKFNGGNGLNPEAIIFNSSGTLYGTTNSGASGYGLLYDLGSAETENVIYQFSGGLDGGGPVGPLVLDKAGNLYGVTQLGGSFGSGVVYELTP
jgi:uncharacterized repeat protein (TIGR03803 family)